MNFISDEDIERVLDFLRTAAVQCAKAKAERVYVEEFKKVLKGQIMREHPEKSLGAQEAEALADPRYLLHLDVIKTAVESDVRIHFLREAALAKLEAWRTLCATERANKL